MTSAPRLERDARVIPVLLDMYERMGDRIAMQYGGSEMHRQMANDKVTKQKTGTVFCWIVSRTLNSPIRLRVLQCLLYCITTEHVPRQKR